MNLSVMLNADAVTASDSADVTMGDAHPPPPEELTRKDSWTPEEMAQKLNDRNAKRLALWNKVKHRLYSSREGTEKRDRCEDHYTWHGRCFKGEQGRCKTFRKLTQVLEPMDKYTEIGYFTNERIDAARNNRTDWEEEAEIYRHRTGRDLPYSSFEEAGDNVDSEFWKAMYKRREDRLAGMGSDLVVFSKCKLAKDVDMRGGWGAGSTGGGRVTKKGVLPKGTELEWAMVFYDLEVAVLGFAGKKDLEGTGDPFALDWLLCMHVNTQRFADGSEWVDLRLWCTELVPCDVCGSDWNLSYLLFSLPNPGVGKARICHLCIKPDIGAPYDASKLTMPADPLQVKVSTHVDWADNGLSPYPVHEQLERDYTEAPAHFSMGDCVMVEATNVDAQSVPFVPSCSPKGAALASPFEMGLASMIFRDWHYIDSRRKGVVVLSGPKLVRPFEICADDDGLRVYSPEETNIRWATIFAEERAIVLTLIEQKKTEVEVCVQITYKGGSDDPESDPLGWHIGLPLEYLECFICGVRCARRTSMKRRGGGSSPSCTACYTKLDKVL